MPRRDEPEAKSLETLHTLLTTARHLAQSLADDPRLDRLERAFRILPDSDREPILGVIEKNAFWRRIADETQGTTGITASV